MSHDPLHDLLDHSAPGTMIPREEDLATMVREAEHPATSGGRPRVFSRRTRLVVGAGVAAIVVAGSALAAAAALNWSGWVDDPAGEYRYTLPSGATCTTRTGGIVTDDPALRAAVERWYRETDVMGAADVAGQIALLREDPIVLELDDGTTELLEPGSPHYDADREYKWAVDQAVSAALAASLASDGFSFAGIESAHGETLCSNDGERSQ